MRNMKYYAIERKSREFTRNVEKVPRAEVLDYACGNGRRCEDMAKMEQKMVLVLIYQMFPLKMEKN